MVTSPRALARDYIYMRVARDMLVFHKVDCADEPLTSLRL